MKKFILLLILSALCFAVSAQMTARDSTQATRPHCTAITQAGTQCKHFSVAGTQFCHQHDPSAPHCGATTKSGKPCARTVKAAGTHCSQHTTTNTN